MRADPADEEGGKYVAMDGPGGTIILIPDDNAHEPPAPSAATPRRHRTTAERDAGLKEQLTRLAPLFPGLAASAWGASTTPYSALVNDCRSLAAQPAVSAGVRTYLDAQP